MDADGEARVKTLVVYFFRKGYARRIAESIAAARKADLLQLRTPERTTGIPGFWWCGRFGMHRWPMALEEYAVDPAGYDRVVIVSPVWVFSACAPVWAFCRREAGKVRAAEYVLLHFSPLPMRYPGTVRALDATLGISHAAFRSIVCCWGHVLRDRTFNTRRI